MPTRLIQPAQMRSGLICSAVCGILLLGHSPAALSDCSLTNLNNPPLPDRAYQFYKGFPGGLYPDFANNAPPAHLAAAVDMAENEIRPVDSSGAPAENGKIVMTSIGMSNTTQEFASKGPDAFKRRADLDPAKNPRLVIVDGAQGGQPSTSWTNVNATTWNTVHSRLAAAGVNSNQVQVLWMKQARPGPSNDFPVHAQLLQGDLEQILRNAKVHFPNLKIAYVSSRTRSYSAGPPESQLNPEPQAFESGFSVKWMIEKQIGGDAALNFRPQNGPVLAPLILWGPYLWADGTAGRSDGFVWRCDDLENDRTHPNTNGTAKVGAQLLAYFKTHPAATPWFLRSTTIGHPPTCSASASATDGVAPLAVLFSAQASDNGSIADIQWTFDDGTFASGPNPAKTFFAPGTYRVRVTVTDNDGNTVTETLPITVAAAELREASRTGSQFQFDVAGATNQNHVVQMSAGLTGWLPVATNRGPFTFIDSNIFFSERFYRVLVTPPDP